MMGANFPPQLPPERGVPALACWPALAGLVLRALIDLARARVALARLRPGLIERRNRAAQQVPVRPAATARGREPAIRAWIGFVVPRVATRLPWRADCLVQALAGQSWLAREGIASRIVIGVCKESGAQARLESHAWLECADAVLIGGPIDRYTPIVGRILAETNGAETIGAGPADQAD